MNRILIAILAFVAWTVLAFWAGREWRDRSADLAESKNQTTQATLEVQAQADTRATEHKQAETLAAIGEQHEQARAAASTVPDAVVADLRAGNLRLRDGWASCETQRLSDAATGTRERDEAAQRREEFAGRVVRIGRDADDQLAACQAVIQADRQ